MKLILVILSLLSLSTAEVFKRNDWKQVKSPLDSPRYQLIMSKIFPQSTSGKLSRLGRISNGELARLGQFVHQALLLTVDVFGDTYVCGGAIISHNWILTAAHCLDEIIKVSVYVGIIDRINGPAVWGIDVTDKVHMIIHENYNATNIVNDIALIRLVSTIKNDPNVGIVNLPMKSDANILLDGFLATIAGFGRYSDTSGPSQQLRWVQTLIASNEKCEKVYGKANVRETNLCLDTTGGRSTCQGDSGGGLTLEIEGRKVVAGIVSYGAASSCTSNHPTVFTRVTSFLDWIEVKTSIKVY